jgi:uncharacterized LabA/DUF88 family protein
MLTEPSTKRAIAFVDEQNLFYAAKEAFGYTYPNYNPLKLAQHVCQQQNWQLAKVRFYTGIPDPQDNAAWHHFWTAKLAYVGRVGIETFSRSLRYRNQTVKLPNGQTHTFLVGQEKGVDIRLALDMVRLAHENAYDLCLVFSQDQDLTEAVEEIKRIAREQKRWIKAACAFPSSPTLRNRRGIDKTDWIRIDRTGYNACLDPRDYRLKSEV